MTMFSIEQIDMPTQKSDICDSVLHALPKWFGVETPIADYVHNVSSMPFWAVFDEKKPIGFLALKTHNPDTSAWFWQKAH